MLFELVETETKYQYQNLIKFQRIVGDYIPLVDTNYWSRLIPQDSTYIRKHATDYQITQVINGLGREFCIDLSVLSIEQSKLFISHFLLVFREIDRDEMINYIDYLRS